MNKNFSDCVVFFGGSSEERLVSVASAQNLASQIPEATLWFLSPEGKIFIVPSQELLEHKDPFTKDFKPNTLSAYPNVTESLMDLKGKVVIIALHGTEGEDGKLQAIFEKAGITFTGTGSEASARSFDKVQTKVTARNHKLPVVEEVVIQNFNAIEVSSLKSFFSEHKKIVLKPFANGSSVGLFIITNEQELADAIRTIKEKGLADYLAEPFIEGREITVGVRERKDGEVAPLLCSEVRVVKGRNFDYEGKYLGKGVEEITPAPLSAEEAQVCKDLALKLHKIMDCKGYSRTDMILTAKGPVLLEINTLPGLSKASFIPQQLTALGENLRDFFFEQINLTSTK